MIKAVRPRPKHQALVLKAYPARVQKNAVDVKANSSELSYLLYYVSTRRSKLQKVGAFLEKRTARDVWRNRIGNVQVTLDICRALIEKCPRDLNLYASSILSIFTTILKSRDISLIEDSLPCFNAFCTHHDGATLSSDENFVRQFEEVLRLYANCAISPGTTQQLRWRSVGLKAVKSISSSEALSSADAKQQIAIITPVALENVYTDDEDFLRTLMMRLANAEAGEDSPLRPRMSIGTADGTIANTVADEDKLEEEDIGLLALQSLKKIFDVSNNAGQIRFATASFLDFVVSKPNISEIWMTGMIEIMASWTSVQYRFLILLQILETLVASPMTEASLGNQLIYSQLISWLLSSTVNLVGLSVMDVLLTLIARIIKLLQLESSPAEGNGSANGSSAAPPVAPPSRSGTLQSTTAALFNITAAITQVVTTPSSTRKELLSKLKRCIADLATHIYYSEQISDIVAELLVRLKPSNNLPPTTDPVIASNSAAGSLTEKPNVDEFFSFATARAVALKAVKEVLLVANQREQGGVGRNTVPLSVWEGTHWLLRDEEKGVRKAYIDALCTYLRVEVGRSNAASGVGASITEANNLMINSRTTKLLSSGFMKLLHLSIYETCLTHAGQPVDMQALYRLLVLLSDKIGLPAIACGIPMVYKLDADANEVEDTKSHVALKSLTTAYLASVAEQLDLLDVMDDLAQGISGRKQGGLWFLPIQFPLTEENETQFVASSSERHASFSADRIEDLTNRSAIVGNIIETFTPGAHASFPQKIKEQLLQDWNKETVLAEVEAMGSQQNSFTDSRHHSTGGGTLRPHLLANEAEMRHSPRPSNRSLSRPSSRKDGGGGGGGGVAPHGHGHTGGLDKFRSDRVGRHSIAGKSLTNVSSRQSSSSHESTVRAGDLKRMLTSGGSRKAPGSSKGGIAITMDPPKPSTALSSESSGSLLVADDDDFSFTSEESRRMGSAMNQPGTSESGRLSESPTGQRKMAPELLGSSSSGTTGAVKPDSPTKMEKPPPVPRLPSNVHVPGEYPETPRMEIPGNQGESSSKGASGNPVLPATEFSSFSFWDNNDPTGRLAGTLGSGGDGAGGSSAIVEDQIPDVASANNPVVHQSPGSSDQPWWEKEPVAAKVDQHHQLTTAELEGKKPPLTAGSGLSTGHIPRRVSSGRSNAPSPVNLRTLLGGIGATGSTYGSGFGESKDKHFKPPY